MKTELRLFLKWGIEPAEDYVVGEQANRTVQYADKKELEENLVKRYPQKAEETKENDESFNPFLEQMRKKRNNVRTD